MLGTEDHIEVVAEAENGEEAIHKAAGARARRRPDGRAHAAGQRHRGGPGHPRPRCPTTKILMLTVSDEEDDLFEAVKAGANGYLLKEISVEEVAEAIRAVVQGQSLISPVDGVEAAQRVQRHVEAGRGEAAVPGARAHRPASSRSSSSWPRA